MSENGLIIELQAVITDHRHAQLAGDFYFVAKEISLQVGMSHGHVALVKGVAPMVLGIEHHAFGAGIAGCAQGVFQIDFEISLGRGVALPLHHPIGLVGEGRFCRLPDFVPERARGKQCFLKWDWKGHRTCQKRTLAQGLQELPARQGSRIRKQFVHQILS